MWRALFNLFQLAACTVVGSLHGWMCYRIQECLATEALMLIGAAIGALVAVCAIAYRSSVPQILMAMGKTFGAVIYLYNVRGAKIDSLLQAPRTGRKELPPWLIGSDEGALGDGSGTLLYVAGALGLVLGFICAAYVPFATEDSAFEQVLSQVVRWTLIPLMGVGVGLIYAFIWITAWSSWASRLNILLGGLVGAYIAVLVAWSWEGEPSAVPAWGINTFLITAQATIGMVAGAIASLVQLGFYRSEQK